MIISVKEPLYKKLTFIYFISNFEYQGQRNNMKVSSLFRGVLSFGRNSQDSKNFSLLWESNLLKAVIFCYILSSCEKAIQPSRFDLLTSTVWGETNYEITDPELYTCVFEPGGDYYTSYKGYQTYNGYWQLIDDRILKIDEWEVEISKLTENTLEYKAETSFFGFFTYDQTFTLQSLDGTKVTTIGVSDLSKTSGTLHGFIRSSETTEVLFEYGTSNAYGSEALPLNNSSAGPVNKNIEVTLTGLNPATIYYYRHKAVNESGIHYGNAHSFRTFNEMTVNDADSNIYNTITIGNQVWMAENLMTTKYSDGIPIPNVRDDTAWSELSTPAYCLYGNDSLYGGSNGVLYNWYTVNTGKLCPSGWHVPVVSEWNTLVDYLGYDVGSKMMEGLYNYNLNMDWLEASNESGFSAFHTNGRMDNGYFTSFSCYLWINTEYDIGEALHASIQDIGAGYGNRNKKFGLPVRCIKD